MTKEKLCKAYGFKPHDDPKEAQALITEVYNYFRLIKPKPVLAIAYDETPTDGSIVIVAVDHDDNEAPMKERPIPKKLHPQVENSMGVLTKGVWETYG